MRHITLLALIAVCAMSWIQGNAQSIVILDCPQDSVVLCAPDPGFSLPDNNQLIVGPGAPGVTTCSGHLRLPLKISDSCGIIIRYIVDILPFDGGDTVRLQDTSDVFLDYQDNVTLVLDSKLFGTSPMSLNGIDYNTACPDEPGGFHRLLWTVMDECGDLVICDFLIRLEDCVSPRVTAIGLASVVMPSSMTVTLSAQDLIHSVVDDCSPENWILHSFDEFTFTPTRTFTCESIDENGGPSFLMELWSADAGVDRDCSGTVEWSERNLTQTNAFIVIDQNEQCQPEEPYGRIYSENQVPIEGVDVTIGNESGPVILVVQTDADGIYDPLFINPLLMLEISAAKGGDDKVGVSTLDLIKIQKHLLGIEAFSSPYKYIAADANNSGSVSAADLLELRKLILRINQEHPNNESWRFVPAAFTFSDPSDPWPFDESLITNGIMNNDFVGMKIGDLNGSVTQALQRRAKRPLLIEADNQILKKGGIAKINITSNNFQDIIGFQFTLKVEGLKILNIIPGKINIETEQVAIHENAATVSWFNLNAVSADRSDVLFSVVAKVLTSGPIRDKLKINSSLTPAEAYTLSDIDEEVLDVELMIHDNPRIMSVSSPWIDYNIDLTNLPDGSISPGHNTDLRTVQFNKIPLPQSFNNLTNDRTDQLVQSNSRLDVYQNKPNPFNSVTTIPINISESGKVSLWIFNALGREVYFSSSFFPAGKNAFRVDLSGVEDTGLMFYRIGIAEELATKKMIKLD